jgi:hypothetical protein
MRKLALGLASAGAFAAITIGLAGPAIASPDYVVPSGDDVYSTNIHPGAIARPVDCAVHVNYQGSPVDTTWC